jgi:hypothetical protein
LVRAQRCLRRRAVTPALPPVRRQARRAASVAAVPAGQLAPTATPNAEGNIYTEVGEGDSFWAIAARHGMTLEEIYELNNAGEGDFVSVGDMLIVGPAHRRPRNRRRPARKTKKRSQRRRRRRPHRCQPRRRRRRRARSVSRRSSTRTVTGCTIRTSRSRLLSPLPFPAAMKCTATM